MTQNDETANGDRVPVSDADGGSLEETDALFACLANYQRRTTLLCLSGGSDPLVIEELVRGVSERLDVRVVDDSREVPATDVAISLVHNHIPKMRDAGIVDVDCETRTVRQGDQFETARTLLEAM